MYRKLFRFVGSAILAAACSQAVAATVNCHAFTSTATGYDACVGLTGGNTNLAGGNAAFTGDAVYSTEYKDDPNGGPNNSTVFDLINNGNDTVTLTFLQNVGDGSSTAVIGLKFGGAGVNQLGYFRFNNADFDAGETLTFAWNPSFQGDGISHATLYANSVTPPERSRVPEPATAALMLAGLAGLGLASRRRRAG